MVIAKNTIFANTKYKVFGSHVSPDKCKRIRGFILRMGKSCWTNENFFCFSESFKQKRILKKIKHNVQVKYTIPKILLENTQK